MSGRAKPETDKTAKQDWAKGTAKNPDDMDSKEGQGLPSEQEEWAEATAESPDDEPES